MGAGWVVRRGRRLIATAAAWTAVSCGGQTAEHQPSAADTPAVSQATGSIRFAIQVGRDAVPPIYSVRVSAVIFKLGLSMAPQWHSLTISKECRDLVMPAALGPG